jgi:hypothetical protein
MSPADIALGLGVLAFLALTVGLRLLGRYLERNLGKGRHPRLEGDGDRVLAPSRRRRAAREEPSAFGPVESGSPFGED